MKKNSIENDIVFDKKIDFNVNKLADNLSQFDIFDSKCTTGSYSFKKLNLISKIPVVFSFKTRLLPPFPKFINDYINNQRAIIILDSQ